MRSSGKNRSRGEQWAVVESPVVPDWEAAHIFLEVARSGSFRAAAQKLQQSVNALRRKIDAFERDLGLPLFTRHVNGVQLTDEGTKIYHATLQMESASFDLLQARNLSDKQVEGVVRLSVTEGMGTYWLLPQLVGFHHANPKLTVNLMCGQKPADLLRLEADLSVQLQRPKQPDLKVVKLGSLHLMLFAAKSYLDSHGDPSEASDFTKHRIAVLSDDERQWLEAYKKFLPGVSPAGLVSLRTNSSTAHFSAVFRGIGMGILPTYVQALGANLVPLNFGGIEKTDIWLAYRPDAKRIARIRGTIDWIVQAYNPRRFPWFRDEFVHPGRFAEAYKGAPLPGMLMSAAR